MNKGNARNLMDVLCVCCGASYNVAYDGDSDTFICYDCVSNEQIEIERQLEELEEDYAYEDNYSQELERRNR